jgi:bacteriorhodopsin
MPTPGAEQIWLWLGAVGMLVGTLYFLSDGWGVEDRRRREFYVVVLFATGTAFVNYLAMAVGFGIATVELGGRPTAIYWARYTDWIFTTPLLFIALGLLAGATRNQLALLVGLDGLMVVAGVLATLSTATGLYAPAGQPLVWWVVSTAFLLGLLYYLFGPLTARAEPLSAELRSTFRALRNLVAATWLCYPVWWLAGTNGLGVTGIVVETAGFVVLDLVAKLAFGYVLLSSDEALEDAAQAADGAVGPKHPAD